MRSGSKTIVVTVLDTCADSDCSGCCTQNKGNADALIDLESYTNERWGVPDGRIQWADLGPTQGERLRLIPTRTVWLHKHVSRLTGIVEENLREGL